jgi:hypothetical protein
MDVEPKLHSCEICLKSISIPKPKKKCNQCSRKKAVPLVTKLKSKTELSKEIENLKMHIKYLETELENKKI